jgi:hypothetical protein
MKKIMKTLAFAFIATIAVSSANAQSLIDFNSETGTGFVGKGNVQLAFNWNNAGLQNNAGGVTFQYHTQEKFSVTCEWETVTGGKNSKVIPHAVTKNTVNNVNNQIAYDARTRKQINGFILNGWSSSSSSDNEAPVVGDSCPQGGSDEEGNPSAKITLVTSEGVTGGLYVVSGGVKVILL